MAIEWQEKKVRVVIQGRREEHLLVVNFHVRGFDAELEMLVGVLRWRIQIHKEKRETGG